MKTTLCLIMALVLNCLIASGQEEKNNFKDGYAIREKDTIPCKILYNQNHPNIRNKITLIINNEETTYLANGPVIGFAITNENINVHYGSVFIKNRNGMNNKTLFVKKLVIGVIELYEHHYNIYKTVFGTSNSTFESFTDYYMARNDMASLISPAFLHSFKKKEIAPYINNNIDFSGRINKKLSLEELITVIKEYNNWSVERKSPGR